MAGKTESQIAEATYVEMAEQSWKNPEQAQVAKDWFESLSAYEMALYRKGNGYVFLFDKTCAEVTDEDYEQNKVPKGPSLEKPTF